MQRFFTVNILNSRQTLYIKLAQTRKNQENLLHMKTYFHKAIINEKLLAKLLKNACS